jgi:FAD-linked sulfhydryl oxidase
MMIGPDGKPCRVCDSFKQFATKDLDSNKEHDATKLKKKSKSMAATATAKRECPPDSRELGSATWTFLHTMAAYYPETPTASEQKNVTHISNLYCTGAVTEDMFISTTGPTILQVIFETLPMLLLCRTPSR